MYIQWTVLSPWLGMNSTKPRTAHQNGKGHWRGIDPRKVKKFEELAHILIWMKIVIQFALLFIFAKEKGENSCIYLKYISIPTFF